MKRHKKECLGMLGNNGARLGIFKQSAEAVLVLCWKRVESMLSRSKAILKAQNLPTGFEKRTPYAILTGLFSAIKDRASLATCLIIQKTL